MSDELMKILTKNLCSEDDFCRVTWCEGKFHPENNIRCFPLDNFRDEILSWYIQERKKWAMGLLKKENIKNLIMESQGREINDYVAKNLATLIAKLIEEEGDDKSKR